MQINPILLLLFGELLLVTTVVSVVLIAVSIARKRGDRAAAGNLISRIKKDDGRRKEETRKIIEAQYGLQGEKLEALSSRIDREEKRFYQALINLYLKRDATALGSLNVTFEGVTEPYRGIELPIAAESGSSDISVSEEEDAESEESREVEIEQLSGENHRLSEELKITMETMGKMIKEYATMYGGQSNSPDSKEIGALLLAEEEGEQEEEALLSEQNEPVTVESSETPGDEEPVRSDPDPDDIDSLLNDAALQREDKAEIAQKGSEDQTLAQENIAPDAANAKDDEWGDLEIMPEDDELQDIGSEEK